MKRLVGFTILLSVCIWLVGCGQGGKNIGNTETNGSKGHSNEKFEVDADVVNTHGNIEGLDYMDLFYNDVTNGKSADVRIVHYTIEGDPIISDAKYDGNKFEITYDTTLDQYGSGDQYKFTCENLIKEENPTNISYFVTGCDNDEYSMFDLLHISFNLRQQDAFEVHLKYGENFENEIDTIEKYLNKSLDDGTSMSISDFDMSDTKMQEIYRMLVMANFLEEKTLNNRCDNKGDQYDLKVIINGATKEFEWSPVCDNSSEAEKLTEVAKYIIEMAEKEDNGIAATVQGYVFEISDNKITLGEDLSLLDYTYLKDLPTEDLLNYSIKINADQELLEKVKNGDKVRITLKDPYHVGKQTAEDIEIINMN